MRAHPEKPMEGVRFTLTNRDPEIVEQFLKLVVGNAERWADEGWGGYFSTRTSLSLLLGTSMLDHRQAEESMKPLLDFAHHHGVINTLNVTSYRGFGEFTQDLVKSGFLDISRAATNIAMSSRIVPRENFEGTANKAKLVEVLNDMTLVRARHSSMPPFFLVCITGPNTYSRHLPKTDQKGGAGYASVTPAWRAGLWHVVYTQTWGAASDPSAVRDTWEQTGQVMDPLRQLTPKGGAYFNEADLFEPDPVGAFWGTENYARLLTIKKDLDPDNLMTVHQGIGWEKRDPRYSCYPKPQA